MMSLLALLAAASAADPALVARADELNARYVECMFAVSRHAREQAIDEARFPALLAASCETERLQLHEVFIAVRVQRGSSPAQAEAEWEAVEAQGRASVERAYRIGSQLPQ